MYCKYCGKPIDGDSVFCPHCGKKQTEENVKSGIPVSHPSEVKPVEKEKKVKTQPNNPHSHRHILYICVGVVALVLIIWGAISFFGRKTIADITIDKVTKELADATKRYDSPGSFHEGLARVVKEKKYGFIDKLGHEIIPCKYDHAESFDYGVAIVKIGEKKGLIDQQGNTIVPCIFDRVDSFDKDSTARASLNGKEGRINIKGEIVIPFEYDTCGDFCEGLAPVEKDGLYGFIDKNNKLVIPYKYKDVYDLEEAFVDGLAGVKSDGYDAQWGYIDKTGKIIIPFQEGTTGIPFFEGLSPFCIYEERANSFRTWIAAETQYIDKSGNIVYKFKKNWSVSFFFNGYARVIDTNNHYLSLFDRRGNMVIPFGIYNVIGYPSSGFVSVIRNNRYGLFNPTTNQEAIPCIYEEMQDADPSEGLVAVKKDGKWGYVSTSNKIIIPFLYDYAYPFSEGFGKVKRYGKYGYVDRYGNDTFE